MPKKKDFTQIALLVTQQAVGEKLRPKHPAAVALGRLGGKKGGPARAKKLTKQQRNEIARKAALARWDKAKKKKTT